MDSKLRDLQRELQRKVDKARPVYEQHKRGELRVLNDAQRRAVENFETYVSDLDEVKAGRMPSKKRSTTSAQPTTTNGGGELDQLAAEAAALVDAIDPNPRKPTGARDDEGEDEPAAGAGDMDEDGISKFNDDGTPKTGKQLKRERAAARKLAKERGGKGSQQRGRSSTADQTSSPIRSIAVKATDLLSDHERFVQAVAEAKGPIRKELVNSFVTERLDKSRLTQLQKDYDEVCQLRRGILNGTIKPSRIEQSKVQFADAIKRDLETEQQALHNQGERIRTMLLAEVADYEQMLEDAAAVEEEGAAVATVEAVKEETAEDDEKADDDETSGGLERQPSTTAGNEKDEDEGKRTPVEDAATEAAACQSEGDSEPAADEDHAEEKDLPLASQAAPEEDAVAETATLAPVEDEKEVPVPEKPATPPPPPPPKEIDWSTVTITRNRAKPAAPQKSLADPANRASSPGRGAPASPPPPPPPPTMPSLDFSSSPSAASGDKPSSTKKGAKGGKPTSDGKQGGPSAFRQAAAARLAKDLKQCTMDDPLPLVRVVPVEDNLFLWAVNVSVVDGPMAGTIVPLEIVFSDFYPQEPPLVRSPIDIPHSAIVLSSQSRHTVLCMDHTALVNPQDVTSTHGWSPSYSAWSVLSQLQCFFATENFARLEKSLGPKLFAQRVKAARIAVSNYSCSKTGHSPATPTPAVPFVNGPLRHAAEAVRVEHGAIQCRATGEGNTWQHAFSGKGPHTFRAVVHGGAVVLGVTADGSKEDQSALGKVEGTVAFDTETGSVWKAGAETKLEESTLAALAPLSFPLPTGTPIDVTMRPEEGTVGFAVCGIPVGVSTAVPEVAVKASLIPAFCLASAQSSVQLLFYIGAAAVPTPIAPSAVVSPAPQKPADSSIAGSSGSSTAASPTGSQLQSPPNGSNGTVPMASRTLAKPVRCVVSMADSSETVLGIAVEVTKRHRTFVPAEMHLSNGAFVAVEAFPKVQGHRSPAGYRFDAVMPLLLNASHTVRAMPHLKRAITALCRNPAASTMYEPPFRPQLVTTVFSELLRSVVRDLMHTKSPDYGEALVLYCRLVHGFAAIANEYPSIVAKEAESTITVGDVSSTVIFNCSTVATGLSWPDVVRQAIKAELNGRIVEADADAFEALKRSLPKLLIGGAMAHAVRSASLQRAVEQFAANEGGPSAEMVAEFEGALTSRASVDSWDGLCDYFGVSMSASDVIGL